MSARTRRWVHVFLGVFVVTGVLHLEVFPFSGFRLFSELRTAERVSWQIAAVAADGTEARVSLSDLSLAYASSAKLIEDFESMSETERDAVCHAWATPLREEGIDVASVRVYSVVTDVRPDAPRPARHVAYECGAER